MFASPHVHLASKVEHEHLQMKQMGNGGYAKQPAAWFTKNLRREGTIFQQRGQGKK